MGYNPQESLENTINTMGTLLGIHPIVPWINTSWSLELLDIYIYNANEYLS